MYTLVIGNVYECSARMQKRPNVSLDTILSRTPLTSESDQHFSRVAQHMFGEAETHSTCVQSGCALAQLDERQYRATSISGSSLDGRLRHDASDTYCASHVWDGRFSMTRATHPTATSSKSLIMKSSSKLKDSFFLPPPLHKPRPESSLLAHASGADLRSLSYVSSVAPVEFNKNHSPLRSRDKDPLHIARKVSWKLFMHLLDRPAEQLELS